LKNYHYFFAAAGFAGVGFFSAGFFSGVFFPAAGAAAAAGLYSGVLAGNSSHPKTVIESPSVASKSTQTWTLSPPISLSLKLFLASS